MVSVRPIKFHNVAGSVFATGALFVGVSGLPKNIEPQEPQADAIYCHLEKRKRVSVIEQYVRGAEAFPNAPAEPSRACNYSVLMVELARSLQNLRNKKSEMSLWVKRLEEHLEALNEPLQALKDKANLNGIVGRVKCWALMMNLDNILPVCPGHVEEIYAQQFKELNRKYAPQIKALREQLQEAVKIYRQVVEWERNLMNINDGLVTRQSVPNNEFDSLMRRLSFMNVV